MSCVLPWRSLCEPPCFRTHLSSRPLNRDPPRLLFVPCRCFDSDSAKLPREVLATLGSIVRLCGPLLAASESRGTNVALSLLMLQASDKEVDVQTGGMPCNLAVPLSSHLPAGRVGAAKLSNQLASALGSPSLVPFYAAHAGPILAALTASQKDWTKANVYRLGFDSFLRVAPQVGSWL